MTSLNVKAQSDLDLTFTLSLRLERLEDDEVSADDLKKLNEILKDVDEGFQFDV